MRAGVLVPPDDGFLVTIDTSTGVLTTIADIGDNFGAGLAFAPDGTLYRSNRSIQVQDPMTGMITASVVTFDPGLSGSVFWKDWLYALVTEQYSRTDRGTVGSTRSTLGPEFLLLSELARVVSPTWISLT